MVPLGRVLHRLLPAAALGALIALLSIRSGEAAELARAAFSLCAVSVAPALFPFFAACTLVTSLGYARSAGRFAAPLMGALFGVGGPGAAAFVLGLAGGYPTGARTVCELFRRGECSRQESERLLMFCNNCGPAFLLGVAGGTVFGSAGAGFLLWGAHLAGAVTVGLLSRALLHRGDEERPQEARALSPVPPFSRAFPEAVAEALRSTLLVCAYVTLFSVVSGLLHLPGPLLRGLLEMSGGVLALRGSPLPLPAKFAVAGGLLGFGGLSVHCQSLAFLEEAGLSSRRYLLGKLLHGLFAATYSWLAGVILA